jgi:hypothetical protein
MNKGLIIEILEYIVRMEEESDSHYGMRSFDQLLKENDVTDLYFKLKKLLNE